MPLFLFWCLEAHPIKYFYLELDKHSVAVLYCYNITIEEVRYVAGNTY
jgi:hypothetical protein